MSATVEHPGGKVEKLYFSSSARQLMLQHPGHYVALLPPPPSTANGDGVLGNVKRKLKLLPPDAMLNIGSCYKLVSFEDVLSELSDNGSIAHQTSRRRAHSVTSTTSKPHHPRSPNQVSKEQSDVSKAAVKHINQLRAMLSKSFQGPQKLQDTVSQDVLPSCSPLTAADCSRSFSSSIQESALRPVARGGAWRPNLQSIAERGR